MPTTIRYLVLCLAALAAACGEAGREPAAPEGGDIQPSSRTLATVLTAPTLRLDAHVLYYCYHPASPYCVVLKHQVRITSSSTALEWTASKSKPWIILSASHGTTPSTITVSVDPSRLPSLTSTERGLVTLAAAGASNSPQTILVEVNGQTPPALAFSDSAIGFCYYPASTRGCFQLAEDVLFTSTNAALTWRAVSSAPWITIHPASGTTPTTVRVAVDWSKVQAQLGTAMTGSITVASGAASNSPQTIAVKLQFYNWPPPR
jgi:hypothetical protein